MRRTSYRQLYGIRTVIIMIYTPIIGEKKKSIKPNEFTIYASLTYHLEKETHQIAYSLFLVAVLVYLLKLNISALIYFSLSFRNCHYIYIYILITFC